MKQSVLVLWIVLLAGIVFGTGTLASVAQVVFALLAVTHIAEFFVKRDVLTRAGGAMGQHFVQTLIYGFFHWKPLEESQNAANRID